MKHIACTIYVSCLLLFFASHVQAGELTIATLALPPYGYVEDGKGAGLAFEVGNAIAEAAGLSATNTILPLGKALDAVKSGQAAMIIMPPDSSIQAVAEDIGEICSMETVFLGRSDVPYRSARDIRGRKVATVRGAGYDQLTARKNGLVVIPTETFDQALRLALSRQVDGVVAPRLGTALALKRGNYPARAFGKPIPLSTTSAHLYLSKTVATDKLRDALTTALDTVIKSGTVRQRIEKYSL